MENDLIHRSTALAILRDLKEAVGNYAPVDDVDDAIDMVKGVNAVDAEPVRHGRWMPYYEPMECFVDVYLNTEIRDVQVGWICSKCGRYEQHSTVEEMPFCHCGAKMDAEVEG